MLSGHISKKRAYARFFDFELFTFTNETAKIRQ